MTPGVTAAYNWTQFPVIADIGGGIGTRLPLSSMLLPPQKASVRQTAFESGVETRIALLRVLQEHKFERVAVELDPSKPMSG